MCLCLCVGYLFHHIYLFLYAVPRVTHGHLIKYEKFVLNPFFAFIALQTCHRRIVAHVCCLPSNTCHPLTRLTRAGGEQVLHGRRYTWASECPYLLHTKFVSFFNLH